MALAVLTVIPQPARAGPPFITDDPEPSDLHKWEIYNFVNETQEPGSFAQDAGVDLNYGAWRDVQLTATLPLHRERAAPLGVGDIQLAAKFKFLHQHEGTPSVDAAIFPRLFLPTGRGSRGVQLLVPVWVQRDAGAWSVFGGGGYSIGLGTAAGLRNFWIQGIAVARQIRPGFQIGVEQFYQGAAQIGDRGVNGVNFGALVHLHGPFSLIGSYGQGLNRRQTVFYTALKLDL